MKNTMGTLYLLQFSSPLGNEKHQANYYLGWVVSDVATRLAEHRAGNGAKITAAAIRSGFTIELIGAIPGTPADERLLKEAKNHKRFIPVFRGEKSMPTFRKVQPRKWC